MQCNLGLGTLAAKCNSENWKTDYGHTKYILTAELKWSTSSDLHAQRTKNAKWASINCTPEQAKGPFESPAWNCAPHRLCCNSPKMIPSPSLSRLTHPILRKPTSHRASLGPTRPYRLQHPSEISSLGSRRMPCRHIALPHRLRTNDFQSDA